MKAEITARNEPEWHVLYQVCFTMPLAYFVPDTADNSNSGVQSDGGVQGKRLSTGKRLTTSTIWSKWFTAEYAETAENMANGGVYDKRFCLVWVGGQI